VTHAGAPRSDLGAPLTLTKAEDVFQTPTEEGKKLFADGVGYYLNCIATALGGRNSRGLKAVPGLDPKTESLIKDLLSNYVDPILINFGGSRTTASQMLQELSTRGSSLKAWLEGNQLAVAAPPP